MSKTISFKLTDGEYLALLALQIDSEKSPALTAKRIVCEALNFPESTRSTPVDQQVIEDRIDAKLAPVLEELALLRAELGKTAA